MNSTLWSGESDNETTTNPSDTEEAPPKNEFCKRKNQNQDQAEKNQPHAVEPKAKDASSQTDLHRDSQTEKRPPVTDPERRLPLTDKPPQKVSALSAMRDT